MNEIYYIAEEGRQSGPFSLESLASKNISPDTLVWKPGMTDWAHASSLPELDSLFAQTPPPPRQEDSALWFAMINGKRVGPLPFESIVSLGANADTPVWTQGMPDWTPVRSNPTLLGKLMNMQRTAQGPSIAPGMQWQSQQNLPAIQTNWLTWAIIATIAGFMFSCIGAIFGIIGIVNADKANRLYQQGYRDLADQANGTAKTMTIIALITAGVGLIGSIFVFSGAGNLDFPMHI